MTTDFTGAKWQKATKSGGSGSCVEFTRQGDVIGVRNSRDPQGSVLEFTPAEVDAMLDGAKKGEFDGLLA